MIIIQLLLLSLLFTFTVHANLKITTSWTGSAGTSSWNDPTNWDNGVPTSYGIVHITDKVCRDACRVDFPQGLDIILSELYVNTTYQTGPSLYVHGWISVEDRFVLGSEDRYYYSVSLILSGGVLELGEDCQTTLYYSGNTAAIRSGEERTGLIRNYGTVTLLSNDQVSPGTKYQIGDEDGKGNLTIWNWGYWVVTDQNALLEFYQLNVYTQYYGGFMSTYTAERYPQPTIQWYSTEVTFEYGSGWTFFEGPVKFYSDRSSITAYHYYNEGLAPRILCNAPGLTISNAIFAGVSIRLYFDTTFENSDFTYNTFINGSLLTTAYLLGDSTFKGNAFFACFDEYYDTAFKVIIENGARVTSDSSMGLFGSVLFINNGTMTFNSGKAVSYVYDAVDKNFWWDSSATFVNLGLMDVANLHINILGSSFPRLPTGQEYSTDIGTFINRGTLQFSQDGTIYFVPRTGKYLQCQNAVTKFGFGTPSSSDVPHAPLFAELSMDGYIAIYIDPSWTGITPLKLFGWVASYYSYNLKKMWYGSFSVYTAGPAGYDDPKPYTICYDTESGVANLYPEDKLPCPYGHVSSPNSGSDACSGTSISIMNLIPSCPMDANCGFDVWRKIPDQQPESSSQNSFQSMIPPMITVIVSILSVFLILGIVIIIRRLKKNATPIQIIENKNDDDINVDINDDIDDDDEEPASPLIPVYIDYKIKT